MSKEKKFYAVKVGRVTGILHSWEECKDSVHQYPGAVYKSFKTEEKALEFLNASDSDKSSYGNGDVPKKSYAYVDGSINPITGAYGAGGFLIDDNGEKYIIKCSGTDPEMATMRNVAGEILGARLAIEQALSLGMKELTIFYDYQGVECWATGMWKRNKNGTNEYYEFCQSVKDKIQIHFRKVKGHTGIEGNEEADRLAKEAVGIIQLNKRNAKPESTARKAYDAYVFWALAKQGLYPGDICTMTEDWANECNDDDVLPGDYPFMEYIVSHLPENIDAPSSFSHFCKNQYEDFSLMSEVLPSFLFNKYAKEKGVKICKHCGSARFIATAHVTQEWLIDGKGNFEECVNDCVEVTHYPDKDDVWTCAECGTEYHE